MEHAVDVPTEPCRFVDERLMQGWAGSVVQDNWVKEEVMEHLTAARAVNDEQGEVTQEFSDSHKVLEKVHNPLVHQLLKLAARTEDLKHVMLRMRASTSTA